MVYHSAWENVNSVLDELEFCGYHFTKNGLKPSPDKIGAVKDLQSSRIKRGCEKFPWNDWIPIKVHTQIRATERIDTKRCEIQMGTPRNGSFQ